MVTSKSYHHFAFLLKFRQGFQHFFGLCRCLHDVSHVHTNHQLDQ